MSGTHIGPAIVVTKKAKYMNWLWSKCGSTHVLFLSDGYEITQMPQFHEEHYTPGVCTSTNKV